MLVVRVFEVAIGWIGTQRFAGLAFSLEYRADLLAGILGIPFVDNIEERGKITVLLVGAVHSVVDGDEADIRAG